MKKARKQANPRWVIGMMSGTSLDGVDAALLRTDGEAVFDFGASAFRPYSDAERDVLRSALGLWGGPAVEAAAEIIQTAHQESLQILQEATPQDVEPDLIGFHGQTVAHAPRQQGTLQIGDGAALAAFANLPVVWDFRSADVELGGEGAPLAPFYHFALARHIGADAPIVFLNLGGVGNITYVDPTFDQPDTAGALLAFDTGPANAPINDLLTERRGVAFDEDGAIAAQGEVEPGALELFLAEAYFARIPPKSLDRNDFSEIIQLVAELGDADATATLTGMCAAAVAAAIPHCPTPPSRVLVTGGGRHNPVLMTMLAVSLDCPVDPVEAVGLDGDMLEAQAFAYLAARVDRGLPTSCPGTTGVSASVGGGIISRPDV